MVTTMKAITRDNALWALERHGVDYTLDYLAYHRDSRPVLRTYLSERAVIGTRHLYPENAALIEEMDKLAKAALDPKQTEFASARMCKLVPEDAFFSAVEQMPDEEYEAMLKEAYDRLHDLLSAQVPDEPRRSPPGNVHVLDPK